MPLINLKTDLKSLKYGLDRRGLGSSKEPFITKTIPEGDTPGAVRDGLLRQRSLQAGIDDASRLTKLLFSTTRGLLFTANNNLLSRTSVKTEATLGPAYGGGNINQGVYLPTSTLAQVATGFTGTHFNLLGLDPSSPMAGVIEGGLFPGGGLIRYEQAAFDFNKNNLNRLVKLKEDKINLDPNATELLSYGGGPGSVLGVGKTRISRTSNTTGINEYGWTIKDFLSQASSGASGSISFFNENNTSGSAGIVTFGAGSNSAYNDLSLPLAITASLQSSLSKTSDSRDYFNKNNPSNDIGVISFGAGNEGKDNLSLTPSASIRSAVTASLQASSVNIADAKTKFNENNPSGSISEVTYGTVSNQEIVTLDTAYTKGNNASSIPGYNPNPKYKTSSYQAGSNINQDTFNKANNKLLNTSFENEEPNSQLIKFYLNFIDPNNPQNDNFIYWQAYVDNFTDSIGAQYDSYNYVGRGYPLYKYNGFNRKIGLDFTIVAGSSDEIIPIYQKLNKLIQFMAPNYSDEGYLRGSFVKLTFGDYLHNTPCILEGFSLNPIFDAGFDITEGKQLPKAIKVSGFSFIPIADNNNQLISNKSTFISV